MGQQETDSNCSRKLEQAARVGEMRARGSSRPASPQQRAETAIKSDHCTPEVNPRISMPRSCPFFGTRARNGAGWGTRRPDSRANYNERVARGWESKSVEAQQAEAGEKSQTPRTRLTPKEAATVREKENLRLARQRVLQQIEASSDPRHKKLMQEALADLDEKLNRLAG